MEEAKKTQNIPSLKDFKDQAEKLKLKAKQDAKEQLMHELEKVFELVQEAVMAHIDQKLDEGTDAIMNHLDDLAYMSEDLGHIGNRIKDLAKIPDVKEKYTVKLNAAQQKIGEFFSTRVEQFSPSEVSVEVNANLGKSSEELLKNIGVEVRVNKEEIIKKKIGMTLAESLGRKKGIKKMK